MDTTKIERALEELMVLNIRTVVGDFSMDKNGVLQYAKDADMIVTQINLAQGDITTAFSRNFLKPPLNAVRDYHSQREQQGRDIVHNNLKAIVDMVKTLASLETEPTPEAAPKPGVVNLTGN